MCSSDLTPPPEWGKTPALVYPGLNPGWIAPTPYYQTTSPVQSKYYWGQHPYQPGSTFDAALYNQVQAPAVPWGVQQARTPFDVNKFINEVILSPGYQAAAKGVAPVAGPVAPGK